MSSTATNILEGLELQLAEVDMLQSMYPNPGEFVLDDPVILDMVRAVTSGDVDPECLEDRIGFTIQVSATNDGKTLAVELVCRFPHSYPFTKPQIFIRSGEICRERHTALMEELNKQIDGIEAGELVVGVVLEWLQERLYSEISYLSSVEPKKDDNSKKTPQAGRDSVTRLWVYSHHIFSKIKRKDIQDYGLELGLRGFCMPGKPGVICAEGYTCDVDEFWYRIRRMTWKKICIKEQEVTELLKGDTLEMVAKFEPFSELILDARGGKGREYHMDLGQFHTYLQNHDSAHIFGLYFGLDGKHPDDGD